MHALTMEELKSGFSQEELGQWVDPAEPRWEEIDFLAWKHPQSGNYFVCVASRDGIHGMVFRMNAGAGNTQGQCELCLASNTEVGVKLATVETHENPRHQIGFHVCGDMGCSERIRGLRSGLFMYETISVGRRIERLQMKMERFAKRVAAHASSRS